MSDTAIDTMKAERHLERLPTGSSATPRALIEDSSGATLFQSGDSTLPLALSGVTKLYTLAMVLREVDRGALSLETPMGELLPSDLVRGLCVVGGTDLSFSITIEHLLSHRSGIVDYIRPGRYKLRSFVEQFLEHDRGWSADQGLEIARHYPGLTKPGATSKARYSSTNYLLLGLILQETTGMSFEELIGLRVVSSLSLESTYVYGPDHYEKYFTLSPVYLGSRVVRIPQALASSGADGAIVSTPRDTLRFLRAFGKGELFDASWIPRLSKPHWASTASPRMGLGAMVSPERGRKPLIVGHSGISGAAVGIDLRAQRYAFLTNFQWSPLAASFDSVTTLLRTMGR